MNGKTAKLLSKYSQLKGASIKDLKREWYSLSESDKDIKRQEFLAALAKK